MDTADEGIISIKKGVRIGYLPQESTFVDVQTIEEVIKNNPTKVRQLILEYNALIENINDKKSHDNKRLEELTNLMDKYNAWNYESRIKRFYPY